MPAWYKTCEAMQKYCEPYFSAIERWRKYEDEKLLKNRIQLLETSVKLLLKYSTQPDPCVFDLSFSKPDATLLPEVVPTAGKTFVEGGDTTAFQASKPLVPQNLFLKIGVYFQKLLLRPIAGWNAEVFHTMNHRNRSSIIVAIEKLFRTAETAGMCYFVSKPLMAVDSDVLSQVTQVENDELSPEGLELVNVLIAQLKSEKIEAAMQSQQALESAQAASMAIAASKASFKVSNAKAKAMSKNAIVAKASPVRETTNNGTKKRKETKSVKNNGGKTEKGGSNVKKKRADLEDEPAPRWTTKHESVNSKVAAYFDIPGPKGKVVPKLFSGVVEKYSPPLSESGRGSKKNIGVSAESLYHVLWDDGDECDYDDTEYNNARDLYDLHFSWTTEHSAVGTEVAQYFLQYSKHPYNGRVTRVLPESAPRKGDELYHILYTDGDECDMTRSEFRQGVALFQEISEQASRKRGVKVVGGVMSSGSKRRRKNTASEEIAKNDEKERKDGKEAGKGPQWTEKHESVGTKVLVEEGRHKSALVGTVKKYAPYRSAEGQSGSAVYYIVIDRDITPSEADVEDDLVEVSRTVEFSESEFQTGRARYEEQEGGSCSGSGSGPIDQDSAATIDTTIHVQVPVQGAELEEDEVSATAVVCGEDAEKGVLPNFPVDAATDAAVRSGSTANSFPSAAGVSC